MTPPPKLTSSSSPKRSLGLKLMVIFALIVLMGLPVMFISIISFDRASRAGEVTQEVGQTYGGAQTVLGPVLVIPYERIIDGQRVEVGDYVMSAETGSATFYEITVSEKSRSLYRVPVYSAAGELSAMFGNVDAWLGDPDLPTLFLDRAKVVIGLQDVTGLQSDVTLTKGGVTRTFEPFQADGWNALSDRVVDLEPALNRDGRAPTLIYDRLASIGLTLLSVDLDEIGPLSEGATLSVDLAFTGAPDLSVLPFAKSTTLSVSSDWPHPGFEGRFPPSERTITETGFNAQWQVPFLRRGFPASGPASQMSGLFHGGADMGVTFVAPLNPYQTVNRALKYAILFIGLVFLSYFLMETLLGVRVHPAQYLLIGLAQAVFYLLLLAFAERFGFTVSFLISAVSTVALTALYAGAVFGRSFIGKAALVFGTVYGLLFVLMRMQDFALMVGALVCFIAIAATLYLTRNLDWYGGRDGTR